MSDPERPQSALKLTRRELMLAVGAGGLAGGVGLYLGFVVGQRRERRARRLPPRAEPFAPNVFLALDGEGAVTVWLTRSEMGQGVQTALPMLVAEELDAPWSSVRVVQAPASRDYGTQFTAISRSVRELWPVLRRAGASAREMLVAAAAAQWEAQPADCATDAGFVVHRESGRRIAYGALAGAAAKLPVPPEPALKGRGEFGMIGTSPARLDIPDKVQGRAEFGLDVRLPGMRFASVARPPTLGARLAGFERERLLARAGVLDAFEIGAGVAIVAETSWAALEASRAIQARWEPGPGAKLDDAAIDAALVGALDAGPFVLAEERGTPQVGAPGMRTIEARYAVPYLAQTPMEPINATAWMHDGRCEVWVPTQAPQLARDAAVEVSGLPRAQVKVNVTLLGGGFGRRISVVEVREVVAIAARVDGPVQLVWSRTDDIRDCGYRNAARMELRATVDASGALHSWEHTIASQSIRRIRSADGALDDRMVRGATELPYRIENRRVRWTNVELPVPIGYWRSISNSYNVFAVECFMDEIARLVQRDPLELRLSMLPEGGPHRTVLTRVAELARWQYPAPAGVGRGVALHGNAGSCIAMIAEVVMHDGHPRVGRVFAALDAGALVHPDVVRAQIEGAIMFGLSAALRERIGYEGGTVTQSNFHDYRVLRFDEAPEIHVDLAESDAPPGGVGEAGVPPIAPALCNALRALGQPPVRALPLS